MKGLVEIPSSIRLSEAYAALQDTSKKITLEEIALWSQWSRFDPRLGEQLVVWIAAHWKEILPQKLNDLVIRQPWPAAFGVLLENVKFFFGKKNGLFNAWANCVMAGISVSENEQFFIGLRKFAGLQMKEDALYALKTYRKWGFLGREVLLNKALSKHAPTLLSKQARLGALKNFLKSKRRITVAEYRQMLGYAISPRQAERDLKSSPELKSVNFTRARFYVKI